MHRLILHFSWPQGTSQVKQEQIDRVLTACAAFSPLVEPYGKNEIFVDLTGVSEARAVVAATCRQASAPVLSRAEHPFFALLAPNKLLARLGSIAVRNAPSVASRFIRTETKAGAVTGELSPGCIKPFLAQLPVSHLWPAEAEVRSRLLRLGVVTVGDITSIPRARLVAEFGSQMGVRLGELARGVDSAPVQALYPERQETVCYDFPPEHCIDDHAPVAAALTHMADKLSFKLQTQGEACSVLMLRVSNTKGQQGKATHLKAPTQNAAVIREICRHLYARLNLDAPPRHLALIATRFTPPAVVQTGLFSGIQSKQENTPDPRRLVNTIQQRFGHDALQFATGLPRQRREKVHALWGV